MNLEEMDEEHDEEQEQEQEQEQTKEHREEQREEQRQLWLMCHNVSENVYLDYPMFKKQTNLSLATDHIISVLINALTFKDKFILHLNVKSMSLSDVERYYTFIQYFSLIMKTMFPEKLLKCHIINAPAIFKQIFSTFSIFIDKHTLKKFHIEV